MLLKQLKFNSANTNTNTNTITNTNTNTNTSSNTNANTNTNTSTNTNTITIPGPPSNNFNAGSKNCLGRGEGAVHTKDGPTLIPKPYIILYMVVSPKRGTPI